MGLGDQALQLGQCVALHTHRFEAQRTAAFVQQPQHGAFAVGAGQGAHAHVHGAGADTQADTAVLRQAFLGNVEVGHDLQARNQGRVEGSVGLHHFAQRAVHPEAHTRMALVGLDVDVTRAVACGLRQQCVEHPDDGRVACGFEQVFHRRQVLHHARQVGVALYLTHHSGGAGFALGIGGADALGQGVGVGGLQGGNRVAAHHLAAGAGIGCGTVPEGQDRRTGVTVFLQQQLVGAGKGVGKGVSHQASHIPKLSATRHPMGRQGALVWSAAVVPSRGLDL